MALTMDHKPDLPAEKARIEAKGGRVFAVEYDDGVDGPARVWLGELGTYYVLPIVNPTAMQVTWMCLVWPCPALWVMRSRTRQVCPRSLTLWSMSSAAAARTSSWSWPAMDCGNLCLIRYAVSLHCAVDLAIISPF